MTFVANSLTRRRVLGQSTALLGILAWGRAGLADSGSHDAAKQVVGRLVGQILELINVNPDDRQQEHRLIAALERQTDLDLLARMTMGRHWRRASARQKHAFVEFFSRYLLQSFATRLKQYASADLDTARDSFAMIGTQNAGKNDIIVQSRVTPPSGSPLKVDWRLRSRNDRLVIIDLVIEGVSLLITKRSEISAVIQRIGIDGLIVELEKRTTEAA